MTLTKNLTESSNRIRTGVSGAVVIRIVGGPAAGREVPIKGQKVTMGRAASADISVPDTVISRLHVAISRDGHSWMIQDLGSTNGTWVKGEKIKGEVELPMKTPVRIGNTLFELYQSVRNDEPTALDESLISYRVSPITVESLSMSAASAEVQVQRDQQKLTALYQVQSLLSKVSDEMELYHKILEVISDVIPSQSSYLLLYIPEEDSLDPVAGRSEKGRVTSFSDSFISRSIVDFVRETNEGILSVDAPNDERFLGHSIVGFNVESVMCVPMMGKQNLCGLIYLSAPKDAKEEFGEEDLKLLTTVAYSAGMAIENTRLVEENIRAERMAAIGVTAAGLSHYIKNILSGLEGSISLLRMGIDGSDKDLMNESWQILSRNHKRLSALVLDLLNLAKEDSLDMARHNTADIVVETVGLVKARAMEEKIKIEMDKKLPGSEFFAEVDSRGIHRVLLNLLNNATDAVRERHGNSGKGLIKVSLHLEDQGQTMILKVADNGLGIPSDKLSKVFEMFYTAGKGEKGTGLGLAVSKRIIENHQGKITVESEDNSGTTFQVKLPVRAQNSITGYLPNIKNVPPKTEKSDKIQS